MPTYLVAFIVSNLVKSNVTDNDPIKSPTVNIWTRPETTGMTKYAHKLTRRVLPFFENYFDMKYSLPKIDLVSIPDFGFGAMENWGLITFRWVDICCLFFLFKLKTYFLISKGIHRSSSQMKKRKCHQLNTQNTWHQ